MRDNLRLLLSGAVTEYLTHVAERRKGLSGPTAGGCSGGEGTVAGVLVAGECAGEKHGDVGVNSCSVCSRKIS